MSENGASLAKAVNKPEGERKSLWKTADSFEYGLLKEYARENRKNMTEAEVALWTRLKGQGLGVKFLRQHIVGEYIVDFLCRKNHLVVEVDGGYHDDPIQQENDRMRTNWLESQGFKVIRFSNEEVLFNIDNVINIVKNNI